MTTVINNFYSKDFSEDFNEYLKKQLEQTILNRLKGIEFSKIEIAFDNKYKYYKRIKYRQQVVVNIWKMQTYIHPDDEGSTIRLYNHPKPYPIYTPVDLPIDATMEQLQPYRKSLHSYYQAILGQFEDVYLVNDYLSFIQIAFNYNTRGWVTEFIVDDKEHKFIPCLFTGLPDYGEFDKYLKIKHKILYANLYLKIIGVGNEELKKGTEEQMILVRNYIK